MTYADGMRQLVVSIAKDAERAVKRGNNALEFANTALEKHRASANDLEQARLQVQAEWELLHENVLPKMDALFASSRNQGISDAIEHLKKARELVEKYATHLANRLTLLDQTNALLIVWKEEELQASGRELREAMLYLEEYNRRYL